MPSSASAPSDSQVDPDLDPGGPARRRRWGLDPWVLAAIAVGAVVGAEARYGPAVWWPHDPGQWPGDTWWINLSGSFLLGALMVVVTELTSPHRLMRPFLGVGVLGGFTTFSTAMVDVHQLMLAGRPGVAMVYLLGTAAAALAATALGAIGVLAATSGWRRLRERGADR